MRLIIVLLSLRLSLALAPGAPVAEDPFLVSGKLTNAAALVEGPNDQNIAKVTSAIFEKAHFLKQPFNDEISSKFLDRYLDSLDNLHLYFLQSDLKDFEKYRTTLDDLTKEGDTTPARIIFARFRERLDQQYHYVLSLLQTEKFEFKGTDRFIFNRKTLPRPADVTEAKDLWRERLRYEYLQEKLNKEKPEEIVKIISRRYTRILRALNEYDDDDVLQYYLTSLARVYDPHSDYMGKAELENFSIGMKLSLFGIGALLQSEDGYCKIKELKPGPASRSKKLKPNDRIIAVAQAEGEPVDVVDMKLSKVVDLIRGPKDTEVRLTVVPADAPDPSVRKVVALIRDEIKLEDQEAKAKIVELPTGDGKSVRLGIIDLPSFYSSFELEGRKGGEPKSTTTDVARLLRKLSQEHIGGVILDLRRNGGGSLEEAINLTGLFIKEGPVVQIKDSDGHITIDKDPDPSIAYEGPLIVLTSRFSASASEILAGALQDYGRALIVGDSSTHGKGTVQSLLQLAPYMRQKGQTPTSNPGAVKITIRKFYRASGSSTQLKGVTPDMVLPSVNNHAEVGEASLENPLPWDTIPTATYEKMNRVELHLAELKRRSETRLTVDGDWAFVREEIERYKKIVAEKSVSMNEAERLKEKKENDERAKARKKDLASRPEPKEKVYEITLKQVDEPGLPAPVTRTNHVTSIETNLSPKLVANGSKTNRATLVAKANGKSEKASPSEPEKGADDPDESVDDKTPNLDIMLEETKRILADYVSLDLKQHGLAVSAEGK